MEGGLINLLRAKSEEGENLLLKDHILETLRKACELKEFVEENREKITFPWFKNESCFQNFFVSLAIALILHDLGKISYKFQKKVYGKELKTELEEFLRPSEGVTLRHEILSSIWASLLLEDTQDFLKELVNWFPKIRTAILLHHYNDYFLGEKDLMEIIQNHPEEVERYLEFLLEKGEELEAFLEESFEEVKKEFKNAFLETALQVIKKERIKDRAEELLKRIKEKDDDISDFAEFYEIDNENPDYEFFVFLGALRRCDYSASAEVSIEEVKNLEEVFKPGGKPFEERIKEKIRCEPKWQKEVLERFQSAESLVFIAPTGSGKTEFALLWAEKNKRKLIYTLPLRVALNDLFARLRENYFEKEYVDILHSTSFIEKLKEEEGRSLELERKLTALKLLASPVLLTTPDQVLLTSLNYYGSDKVISVYPFSSVVIDEIQTYTPEMTAIIIKTLKIVQILGGNILVMTATLPPYFEPFFFEENQDRWQISEELKNKLEKFKLSLKKCDASIVKDEVKNYSTKRHRIKIIEKFLARYENGKVEINEDAIDKYLSKEKNTFIVVNNVMKAVEIYKWLKEKQNFENVFLLHSRLIEKEKDRRINEIKEKIRNEEKMVVVSTQIIEASVDLDFDLMLTEVSPIDSQIQRWGRVFRNRGEKDYESVEPNVIIFLGEKGEDGYKVDKRTLRIYDKRVVQKTAEVLKRYEDMVLSYEDERKMIEDVFEGKLKEDFVREVLEALEFLDYFNVSKKSEAQRIFRRLAGVQAVVPAVMRLEEEEIGLDGENTSTDGEKLKEFSQFIENEENRNSTYEEIEKLFGLSKWEVKRVLYEYSVNVPIFYFEKLQKERLLTEFKGFYVLKIKEEYAEDFKEYGIDWFIKERLKEKTEEELDPEIW